MKTSHVYNMGAEGSRQRDEWVQSGVLKFLRLGCGKQGREWEVVEMKIVEAVGEGGRSYRIL